MKTQKISKVIKLLEADGWYLDRTVGDHGLKEKFINLI